MGDHLQDKFCYWFKIISDFFQIKNSWLGFKNYIRVVHWYAKRKRLTKSTNVRVCSSKERTDVFPPSFSSPGQYQVDNCPPYLSLFRFDTYDFCTCLYNIVFNNLTCPLRGHSENELLSVTPELSTLIAKLWYQHLFFIY